MKKIFCCLALVICSLFCLAGCEKTPETELSTYSMKLVYENFVMQGEIEVEYFNSSEVSLNEVCFHLYPNAFREGSNQEVVSLINYNRAYYNGKSYGDIEITAVPSGQNFSLIGEDENILEIKLNEPLQPYGSVSLKINFTLTMPEINHRLGIGEHTINFGNFYPMLCVYEDGGFDLNGYHSNGDPFYSEVASYDVEFAYPCQYTLASSGVVVSEEEEDGFKKSCIKAENVRDFAMVISDSFNVLTQEENGTQINYYYHSDPKPEESLQTSVKSLRTFNKLFGEYPYSTLSVVEASFVHGGMEFPNIVLISDDLDSYETYTVVIIHEIAHQWWYGVVGNDQFSYGWLDEGLAEFSVALFYEENPEYEKSKESIVLRNQTNYKLFEKIYTNVLGKVDTSFNRPLNQYESEQEYVYTAYVKSFLMHDSLYELLGQKKYISALQKYYKTYSFKIAKPENMVECFEKSTSKNLEAFFKSWLEGKVVIE